MKNQNIFIILTVSALLISILAAFKINKPKQQYDLVTNHIDNMPLIDNDPYAALAYGGTPIEQRGSEFRQWLSLGLKIKVSGASGSGTIIYYDEKNNWAYVQSCGHLWSGNMNSEQGLRSNKTCLVEIWYKNEVKLSRSTDFKAEILYYSNDKGRDISLIRFKPDWIPKYLPIAPEDFIYYNNMKLHSIGCDLGTEIAHYEVEVVGLRDGEWPDLVTTRNSPRPGRSGGGLLTDEYYIGICWGTSSYDGSGNGYFTPLNTIREYNRINGFGWINDAASSLARQIPIIDRNNNQSEYPHEYIPLPTNR